MECFDYLICPFIDFLDWNACPCVFFSLCPSWLLSARLGSLLSGWLVCDSVCQSDTPPKLLHHLFLWNEEENPHHNSAFSTGCYSSWPPSWPKTSLRLSLITRWQKCLVLLYPLCVCVWSAFVLPSLLPHTQWWGINGRLYWGHWV